MFTIKSIHAEPFQDKKGDIAVRLILVTLIPFIEKKRVIPAAALSNKEDISKVVSLVNERISPLVRDYRIMWVVDANKLNERIKLIDTEVFTKDELGTMLFKEVSSLIRDMFYQDFVLDSTVP